MHRSSVSTHSGMRPNNSFKPNLLRYTNNMAERACHIVGSATQVGLTQALGNRGKFHETRKSGTGGNYASGWL